MLTPSTDPLAILAEHATAAVVVRPGDTLVVGIGGVVRPEQGEQIKEALQEQLGCKVLIVSAQHPVSLAVVRGEADDG